MSLLALLNLAAWSAQIAVIVAVALLALNLLRLDAPSVRYLFLRSILAICLLLPLIQPRVVTTDREGVTVVTTFSTGRTSPVDAASDISTTGAPLFEFWPQIVLTALAVGIFARLAWISAGVIRLRKLRRMGDAAPRNVEHDELQQTVNTRATIRYVRELEQPVTFGLRRPVVLLPESLLRESHEVRRAVLAHELWHVRRRDWAWTVLEEGVRAMFWFHPGVRLLLGGIQAAREQVVDELAILTIGSRRHYLDALLVYADRPALFSATAFARRSDLMRRVLLISKEVVMSGKRVVACGAVFVAVVLSAGWYSSQAFPLAAQPLATSQSGLAGPGPLEQRAKPITPENPIPRRTYFVLPDYSSDAAALGLRGGVSVRITLDEVGHIAETRVVGLSLTLGDQGRISMTNAGVEWKGQGDVSPGAPPEAARAAIQSAMEAVLRAVRQWQYAPPAEGPISFSVTVPFGLPNAGAAAASRAESQPSELSAGALRVGGTIKPPAKLLHVSPEYPPEAMEAKVQGVVIIEARIEGDGTVSQARVLRSVPMLDEAALDAVRQWRFEPTLLNGVPSPIVMTVTVNFVLQ